MLKRPARYKHSSLLGAYINYGRKKFYNIGARYIYFIGIQEFVTASSLSEVDQKGKNLTFAEIVMLAGVSLIKYVILYYLYHMEYILQFYIL